MELPAPRVSHHMVLATYAELTAAGVSYNTARSWVGRGKYETIRNGGRTRILLPVGAGVAEDVERTRRIRFNNLLNGLETAFKEAEQYIEKYRLQGYEITKANHFARLEAVYTFLLTNEASDNYEKYEAFNRYFPGEISFKTFQQYCYRIKTQGFESVLRDNRGKRGKEFPVELENLVFQLYKNPKKYNKTYIFRQVREFCETNDFKTPSLRWVQDKCTEYENYIIESRYGKSKSLDLLPFATLRQAQNPNTQWQVDGFTLPFYYEGSRGSNRLTLVAVMDSFSRANIGYCITESENTESILAALHDAVKNTGYIPAEIVFDNHSFQRTQEAGTIISRLEKLGCICRKSENPRFKTLIERSFGILNEQYLKQYAGYIGQGIKSRVSYGRPAPEYTDHFQRSGKWLTKDQIRMNTMAALHKYNNEVRLSREKRLTPRMEMYKNGTTIYGTKVDEITRNTLFLREVSYIVRKGQITITRGGQTHEYALNSAEFMKYNGQRVLVCYSDFSEVYVFDRDENFIAVLHEKPTAFAALADQQGEQRGMFVNAGIKKGIKNKSKQLENDLYNVDPEAVERMNPLTRSKDALAEIRERGMSSKEAAQIEHSSRLVPVPEKSGYEYGNGILM